MRGTLPAQFPHDTGDLASEAPRGVWTECQHNAKRFNKGSAYDTTPKEVGQQQYHYDGKWKYSSMQDPTSSPQKNRIWPK